MDHAPPFDGKPCPMCSMGIRNLAATAHNLVWRLAPEAGSSACAVGDKAYSVRQAVAGVEREGLITGDTHPDVAVLFDVCKRLAAVELVADLYPFHDELKAASVRVAALSDAHFSSKAHSHGS